MPKMKSHRGTAKRIKLTATGKPKRSRAGKNHNLETKSATRRRRLRQSGVLSKSDQHRTKRLLPYG